MEKIIPPFSNYYENIWINIGLFVVAVLAGILTSFIILKIVRIILAKTDGKLYAVFKKNMLTSLLFMLPIAFVYFSSGLYINNNQILKVTDRLFPVLFIISLTWVVIRASYMMEELIFLKYNILKEDNNKERKILTQTQFIKRLFIIIVIIIAGSIILMSFEGARKIGQGILTSAGVLGIIIGVAAQKSIANLLAGFQIAFSQPIKIDDVVIIENEYGKVEEINLTYVVVKLWDLKRLVVPLSYFLEKPFQNWTRETADIIGTVFFYVDYTIPMDIIRKEFMDILEQSPLWDRKVGVLHVTNMLQHCIEMRALISAVNSTNAWDLRCEVREKLIIFIQNNYPNALPRVRGDGQIVG